MSRPRLMMIRSALTRVASNVSHSWSILDGCWLCSLPLCCGSLSVASAKGVVVEPSASPLFMFRPQARASTSYNDRAGGYGPEVKRYGKSSGRYPHRLSLSVVLFLSLFPPFALAPSVLDTSPSTLLQLRPTTDRRPHPRRV
jgi:hypothetical protein